MTVAAWSAAIGLVLLLSLAQTFDEQDAARLVDKALTTVATSEPIRARVAALTFCKAPGTDQVLMMRADTTTARGFDCVYLDNVGYARAARQVMP